MTQIEYDKVANHLAIIQQQFELPQQMYGIVNYQANILPQEKQTTFSKSLFKNS